MDFLFCWTKEVFHRAEWSLMLNLQHSSTSDKATCCPRPGSDLHCRAPSSAQKSQEWNEFFWNCTYCNKGRTTAEGPTSGWRDGPPCGCRYMSLLTHMNWEFELTSESGTPIWGKWVKVGEWETTSVPPSRRCQGKMRSSPPPPLLEFSCRNSAGRNFLWKNFCLGKKKTIDANLIEQIWRKHLCMHVLFILWYIGGSLYISSSLGNS